MAKRCDCSKFGGGHSYQNSRGGRYVRLKFGGRWLWAIRQPGTGTVRGRQTVRWTEVTEEGDLPGEGTTRSPVTTNVLIAFADDVVNGVVVERPASMCLTYGVLTTKEP